MHSIGHIEVVRRTSDTQKVKEISVNHKYIINDGFRVS